MTDDVAETTDLLRRTPDVLRALLIGLPDRWTDTPDVVDGWRPHDVVGHLISAELDDWIPRAERILAQARIANLIHSIVSPISNAMPAPPLTSWSRSSRISGQLTSPDSRPSLAHPTSIGGACTRPLAR